MLRWFIPLGVLVAVTTLPAQAQEKGVNVNLEVVKYDGLKEVILRNRGKVILVEFWADWCRICKEAHFPHLAKLHKRFADQGLVIVTVALPGEDQPAAAVKDDVLRFLKKVKAPFTNVLLDEKDEFWQTKLRLIGPPHTYVFDRQGRWTMFNARESSTNPEALDRLVEESLR